MLVAVAVGSCVDWRMGGGCFGFALGLLWVCVTFAFVSACELSVVAVEKR